VIARRGGGVRSGFPGRNRLGAHGGRRTARSLAHQLHSPTNPEFRQKRRNMELYGTFGKIQRRGNFLVRQAAHHPAKHFFFPPRQLHGTADRMAGLQQFFGFLG
jgi:hypothetical protein